MKTYPHRLIQTSASLMVALIAFRTLANDPTPSEKVVPHQRIPVGEYQNFIGNWDEKNDPVLCALIHSSEQYGAVFQAAAVMHGKKAYAPDKELYDKEQIILVAKVMTAPADMDNAFEDVAVVDLGDTLKVSYKMSDAKSGATFTVKNFMALRIPKKGYKRVLFFEAGKQVADLKPSEGTWCNVKNEAR